VTEDNSQIGTRPSRVLHSGTRWFLHAEVMAGGTAYFPDGSKLFDAFATFEGSAGPVQLTDNAGQCLSMSGSRGVFLDWAPDAGGQVDGAVAFVGKRWADAGDGGSPCDTLSAAGVFRAELTFDGAGNITGIVAQPAAPEFVVNAETFTFRPDGQQLAYVSNAALHLAPDPSGLSPLNAGDYVADPAWSPNGAKIAFSGGSNGTFTINPNGTGLTRLAQGRVARKNGQSSLIHRAASWSPGGTHLVYTEYEVWNTIPSTYTFRVRRMTSSGGDNTVLATTGPNGGFAIGWGAD